MQLLTQATHCMWAKQKIQWSLRPAYQGWDSHNLAPEQKLNHFAMARFQSAISSSGVLSTAGYSQPLVRYSIREVADFDQQVKACATWHAMHPGRSSAFYLGPPAEQASQLYRRREMDPTMQPLPLPVAPHPAAVLIPPQTPAMRGIHIRGAMFPELRLTEPPFSYTTCHLPIQPPADQNRRRHRTEPPLPVPLSTFDTVPDPTGRKRHATTSATAGATSSIRRKASKSPAQKVCKKRRRNPPS
jgi:hypothetical protein